MKKIGIIIPTYNSGKYILECLESINKQNFVNAVSLYIVDDFSNDDTLNKIESFAFNDNIFVKIFKNEKNMGQGYSRNMALQHVEEEYVLFLDSDDLLNEDTLSKASECMFENNSDVVMLDWIYFNDEKETYNYAMNNQLLDCSYLNGDDCADILSLNVYFTTPALYRTDFLINNSIRYGEGYIYEDFEFMVQVAMKANRIDFIHFPLYIVRVNEYSTTKTDHDTDKHLIALRRAVESSLKYLENRSRYSIYFFYRYILNKAMHYTKNRAPIRYRYFTLKQIIKMLSVFKGYPLYERMSKFNRYVFENRLIDKQQVELILYKYYRLSFGKTRRKLLKNDFSKIDKPIQDNKIVFAGFDFEMKGNSKYLYEYLKESDFELVVLDKNSIYSKEYYKELASAKIVIFESWSNLRYHKKDSQVYIQLWHGSPLKRMIFSSNEKYVNANNHNSRKNKFRDYKKWDYFLVDTKDDIPYFNECFAYNNFKYLEFGYPRVKWLIENKDNEELKERLRKKYNVNSPIILYCPTWRDKKIVNLEYDDYLLDIESLKSKYPEYNIISLEHSYLSEKNRKDDIQELLLICDVLISDYSSIIYDAVKIDKKIVLYHSDVEEYIQYRGIYEDKFVALNANICYNQKQLEDILQDVESIKKVNINKDINYNKTISKFIELFNEIGSNYGK